MASWGRFWKPVSKPGLVQLSIWFPSHLALLEADFQAKSKHTFYLISLLGSLETNYKARPYPTFHPIFLSDHWEANFQARLYPTSQWTLLKTISFSSGLIVGKSEISYSITLFCGQVSCLFRICIRIWNHKKNEADFKSRQAFSLEA